MELHGGCVRVDSDTGKGSTFTFDLAEADSDAADHEPVSPANKRGSIEIKAHPRVPVDLGISPAADDAGPFSAAGADGHFAKNDGPNEPIAPVKKSGIRLLVADDDRVNLEVLRAQLEPEGHEVYTAKDGQEALDALHKHGPFDGVLLDVMMPKMTGPEAARRMRLDYPHGTLPILMLTAKTRPEDAVVGLKAGADDYVGKPFHREELLARLEVHLDAARSAKALERFVSPGLVRLTGAAHQTELAPGTGSGRHLVLARFSLGRLAELSAGLDEAAFFQRVSRVVQAMVEQVELHGGVVESMADDGLSVLFEGDAEGALRGVKRALWAAQDAAKSYDLRVVAVLHAGHVNVGVVGTAQWVSLRAMGESAMLAGALGRWTAAHGFSLVLTDHFLGKTEERAGLRRIGTARLGQNGRPVTLFEAPTGTHELSAFDADVDALEAGNFGEVLAYDGPLDEGDPLVRHLRAAAKAQAREVHLA